MCRSLWNLLGFRRLAHPLRTLLIPELLIPELLILEDERHRDADIWGCERVGMQTCGDEDVYPVTAHPPDPDP